MRASISANSFQDVGAFGDSTVVTVSTIGSLSTTVLVSKLSRLVVIPRFSSVSNAWSAASAKRVSFSLLYALRCSAASLRCSFQSSKTSLATATFSAATSLATSKPTCVLSAAFCKPLRKDKRVIRIPKANNKNTSKMMAPSSPNSVRRNVAIAPPTTPP